MASTGEIPISTLDFGCMATFNCFEEDFTSASITSDENMLFCKPINSMEEDKQHEPKFNKSILKLMKKEEQRSEIGLLKEFCGHF